MAPFQLSLTPSLSFNTVDDQFFGDLDTIVRPQSAAPNVSLSSDSTSTASSSGKASSSAALSDSNSTAPTSSGGWSNNTFSTGNSSTSTWSNGSSAAGNLVTGPWYTWPSSTGGFGSSTSSTSTDGSILSQPATPSNPAQDEGSSMASIYKVLVEYYTANGVPWEKWPAWMRGEEDKGWEGLDNVQHVWSGPLFPTNWPPTRKQANAQVRTFQKISSNVTGHEQFCRGFAAGAFFTRDNYFNNSHPFFAPRSTNAKIERSQTEYRAILAEAQACFDKSACVFVGNLPAAYRNYFLSFTVQRAFGEYGMCYACVFRRVSVNGTQMPFAVVQYTVHQDAAAAYYCGQGKLIGDREVRVEWSKQA